MPEINEKDINSLMAEMRGASPEATLKAGIESIIKADAEKAKAKVDAEKKLAKDIKAAEEKIKKIELDKDGEEPPPARERDDEGKFKKIEPATPEENEEEEDDDSEIKIKELIEQMEKMTKEIDALKKRKNYRTKPPAAEEVDEVDDFIKQNITKDYEVVI